MKVLFLMMTLLALTSCQANDSKKDIVSAKDMVSKKYFVKGMTCGGCIFGVKTALGKAESLHIIDKDIEVGTATLQFDKNNYNANETDCAVTKSIEKVTEFKVFLDKEHTKKACGS
jgi:copper chaperone CopZ